MEGGADISFCELRSKEIINIVDGKKLGRLVDLVFECESSKIKGLVAPFYKKVFLFKGQQDIFIPWKCVKKIGADTIIVELKGAETEGGREEKGSKECPPPFYPPPFHFCDRRCTKCAYRECPVRWEEKKPGMEAQYREFHQGENPDFER